MKYLYIILMLTSVALASSIPVLEVKSANSSESCPEGKLCLELSWITLDEVKEITVITEKVDANEDFTSFKLIDRSEKDIDTNGQTTYLHVIDADLSESIGDIFRISIDVGYTNSEDRATSAKTMYVVK